MILKQRKMCRPTPQNTAKSNTIQQVEVLRTRRLVQTNTGFAKNYFELKIKRGRRYGEPIMQALANNRLHVTCNLTEKTETIETEKIQTLPSNTIDSPPCNSVDVQFEDPWDGLLPLKPVEFNEQDLKQFNLV